MLCLDPQKLLSNPSRGRYQKLYTGATHDSERVHKGCRSRIMKWYSGNPKGAAMRQKEFGQLLARWPYKLGLRPIEKSDRVATP